MSESKRITKEDAIRTLREASSLVVRKMGIRDGFHLVNGLQAILRDIEDGGKESEPVVEAVEKQAETLKKYDVHIYPVMRFCVRGVEAASQKEAIEKAMEQVDFGDIGSSASAIPGHYMEYADKIDSYLVDEVGDEDYSESCDYGPDLQPLHGGEVTS